MARATVHVAGRTSRPAAAAAPAVPRGASLVDKQFLRPMLVRKVAGKNANQEKAAIVVVDNEVMIVAPTQTGEPAVYVKRQAADKNYRFVRWLTPQEKIEFPGLPG